MAEESFRLTQERHLRARHIEPISDLVDSLRDQDGRGWVPYVAPMHGGVNARLLFVLRDPGPKTVDGSGSGFLCIENDDPSAERQLKAFRRYGIDPADSMPWNAYPWYINHAPTAAQTGGRC